MIIAEKQKRGELFFNILSCIILALCCAINNMITDYLSLTVVFLSIIIHVSHKNLFAAKYLYVLFGAVSCIVGVLVCETNTIYLREIGEETYRTGAISPLALYYWIFIFFLSYFDTRFSARRRYRFDFVVGEISFTSTAKRYGMFIILCLNLFLFLSVILRPYFILGVDRFGYANQYMPSITRLLKPIPIVLAPLAIICVKSKITWSTKKKTKKIVMIYLPYLLFSFWTGEKFGQIWIVICNLLIASTCLFEGLLFKKEFNIKKIVIICALVIVVVSCYYILSTGNLNNAYKSFFERVAMQGQLWWKTFSQGGQTHIEAFFDECKAISASIISKGNTHEHGVFRLMNMFAREDILESYMKQGIRFSAQGMELPFYFFGFGALLIVPIIQAYLYAFVTNAYINRIKSDRFIEAILIAMFLNILMTVLSQGDIYLLFSNRLLLSAMFMIFAWLVIKLKNGKKENDKKSEDLVSKATK